MNKRINNIELENVIVDNKSFEERAFLLTDGANEDTFTKEPSPDIKNEQSESIKSARNLTSSEHHTDGPKQKKEVAKFKICSTVMLYQHYNV